MAKIADLRARIRQFERIEGGAGRGVLPFGAPGIDRALPGGGLALGALHRVEGQGFDLEQAAAPALFVASILARLEGPVVWCLAARDLFAPALALVGLAPERVIHVEARGMADVLPLMEEALAHRGLAGVVGESDRLGRVPSRRLLLAAERSGVTGFVIRRPRIVRAAGVKEEEDAAVTRWRIAAAPSLPAVDSDRLPGSRLLAGEACWRLDLLRCRSGAAAHWTVTVPDGAGRLHEAPEPAEAVPQPLRIAG